MAAPLQQIPQLNPLLSVRPLTSLPDRLSCRSRNWLRDLLSSAQKCFIKLCFFFSLNETLMSSVQFLWYLEGGLLVIKWKKWYDLSCSCIWVSKDLHLKVPTDFLVLRFDLRIGLARYFGPTLPQILNNGGCCVAVTLLVVLLTFCSTLFQQQLLIAFWLIISMRL